jgi:hypothetical protein
VGSHCNAVKISLAFGYGENVHTATAILAPGVHQRNTLTSGRCCCMALNRECGRGLLPPYRLVRREGENPARWRGHLHHVLPKNPKSKRVKHLAALPFKEVAAFMRVLRGTDGKARPRSRAKRALPKRNRAQPDDKLRCSTSRSGDARLPECSPCRPFLSQGVRPIRRTHTDTEWGGCGMKLSCTD